MAIKDRVIASLNDIIDASQTRGFEHVFGNGIPIHHADAHMGVEAILAWVQTLPEFAVEAVIAWNAPNIPHGVALVSANFTGSLRLLVGLGAAIH